MAGVNLQGEGSGGLGPLTLRGLRLTPPQNKSLRIGSLRVSADRARGDDHGRAQDRCLSMSGEPCCLRIPWGMGLGQRGKRVVDSISKSAACSS